MKRNKQYNVLFIFYAFLRLRVICEETCQSYNTDVGCKNMSLQNGYVCYEWSTKFFGVWVSSSAKLVCIQHYKLNTMRNKIDCRKKLGCRGIDFCYSWDYQDTPACDEKGPSKSTSTFGEAHVSVSPNVTSVTNVAEIDSLDTDSSYDIEVSTEVVFRTSSNIDQTCGGIFTKEGPTFSTSDDISLTGSDWTNTKVMYVSIPSVLGVIAVVLVVVVLICRQPCKREAMKHREDYPLQLIPRETVHSQTDHINSATVVDTEDSNVIGCNINDGISNNDKVNNKYVQKECLDDSYDHLGTRKPIVQDQTYSHTSQSYRPDMYCMSGTYSHTSQSYRPDMYCMSGIPREQCSGETYNTLNKDILPTKSQGIYDLEMTNHLNVIKDDSGAEYSHAVQKEVTDLAKFHQTDDDQTVYLNVHPSS